MGPKGSIGRARGLWKGSVVSPSHIETVALALSGSIPGSHLGGHPLAAKSAGKLRMINAVGETAATKPAFRAVFKKRRCLILADGFFEWHKDGKEKIPTHIYLASKQPFAFAGLWETWKSPKGGLVRSCTIVTTEPNQFMAPIHNRMPVLLSQEAEALWMDPLTENPDVLTPLLIPAPAELMAVHPVSNLVNSPKNSGPECVEPAIT